MKLSYPPLEQDLCVRQLGRLVRILRPLLANASGRRTIRPYMRPCLRSRQPPDQRIGKRKCMTLQFAAEFVTGAAPICYNFICPSKSSRVQHLLLKTRNSFFQLSILNSLLGYSHGTQSTFFIPFWDKRPGQSQRASHRLRARPAADAQASIT